MNHEELNSLLAKISRAKIGIVGDFCLDAYLLLEAERIRIFSRNGPVYTTCPISALFTGRRRQRDEQLAGNGGDHTIRFRCAGAGSLRRGDETNFHFQGYRYKRSVDAAGELGYPCVHEAV